MITQIETTEEEKNFPGRKKSTNIIPRRKFSSSSSSYRIVFLHSRSHRRCSILNVIYEKIFIHLIWREMLPLQSALLHTHQVLFYFLFFRLCFSLSHLVCVDWMNARTYEKVVVAWRMWRKQKYEKMKEIWRGNEFN